MSSRSLSVAKLASTPERKATPQAATAAPPVTDSPGNWKHPRLAEITRRRNAAVFSEKNIRTVIYNVVALAVVLGARQIGAKYPWLAKLISQEFVGQYGGWIWLVLELIPLVNIAVAVLPLFRKPDDLSDIPLTPGQRKLLGLNPSPMPATPGSVYSTPPRYSRTPSMSGSVTSNKSYASSPLSGKGAGSPGPGGRLASSGSPYAQNGSPLFQKAMAAGGVNGARRSSFGSPSPLGASTSSSLFPDVPGAQSPTPGKRSSIGLNSKWLYEKGRRTSGSGWMH